MHLNDTAEQALRSAASEDPKQRYNQFWEFMRAIEQLVETSGDRASFVARTAPLISAARSESDRWIDYFLRRIDGGEEDVYTALQMRTQIEYARELYRGTVAERLFENIIGDEGDTELRGRADQLALDRPDNVPASHRWWRAPKSERSD